MLVLLLIAGAALSGSAAGAPKKDCPVVNSGGWTSIPVGPWPSGTPQIVDYAADITDPSHLLATNGSSVVYSHDSGCTWSTGIDLTLPSQENPSATAEAVAFSFFGADNGVLLVDDQLPVHHPAILVTQDGGATWTNAAPGLAQVRGRPLSLTAGGGRVYLLVDRSEGRDGVVTVSPPHRLYVSDDGGQTWEPAEEEPPGTSIDIGPIPSITTDGKKGSLDLLESNPTRSDDLWLYGSAGLYFSEDGGTTAEKMPFPKGPVSRTEVTIFNESGTILSTYPQDEPTLYRSVNHGFFQTIRTPTPVESSDFPAIAGSGRVFVEKDVLKPTTPMTFEAKLRAPVYEEISPADHRPISDVSTVFEGTSYVVFGRTATTIERYEKDSAEEQHDIDHYYLPALGNAGLDKLKHPRLFGAQHEIKLRPGQSRRVRYTLVVPPTPTPLDVFFLIDTSSSMQEAIDGVRAATFDIIKNLDESGIDVWFGVGQYRSYTSDPAYDRVLDMSPPGPSLSNALNKLEATQGGLETQLAALYQVATGAGQHDRTSSADAYIKPGQQANFRPGSLRVIIHATDEEFSTGRPHPDYETVTDALNAKGIKQIGIDLVTPSGAVVIIGPGGTTATTASDPGPGLRKVAAATGTLAPPEGVDCSGDGIPDIAYNQPIVCPIQHDQADDAGVMGSAVINTLRSLTDIGQVNVGVSDNESISAVVDPATPLTLDFKERHAPEPYTVTYTCPRKLEKSAIAPMTVSATRAAGVLASTRTTVTCKVPGDPIVRKPDPPVIPAVSFFAPLVPLVPVPPRPPEPPTNPNPQPNPQAQAQGQAQGAFAAQEEKQPQLAYAHDTKAKPDPAAAAEDSSDRFAMTRFRKAPSQPPLDPLFILAAAAMSCAAGAALVRQRTQTRFARATTRTRDRRSYGRRY